MDPDIKAIPSVRHRLLDLLEHVRGGLQGIAPAREERLFLLLSIFIGVISGLLVVSFRMAIEWLQVILLGSSPGARQPRLLFVPALVGLVVAVATRFVLPQVKGSGVNQTKAALYIHNGYISFKTVIGKFLLSSLAIGGGFSLGPEDPSLQIGAGVASLISRKVGMSREKLRIFAPIGAAAGLAAAFNAPISAILFVIEEVIGRLPPRPPHLRLHGARGQRQLLHHPSRHPRQHHRLPALESPPAPPHLRGPHPAGWPRPPLHGRTPRGEQPPPRGRHGEGHRTRPPGLGDRHERPRSARHLRKSRDTAAVLIHGPDHLWYAAHKAELLDLLSKAPREESLCNQIGAERTPILFPDLPLASALPHFQRWPLLPITNRAMRGSLEGSVSLEEVLRRYQQR